MNPSKEQFNELEQAIKEAGFEQVRTVMPSTSNGARFGALYSNLQISDREIFYVNSYTYEDLCERFGVEA